MKPLKIVFISDTHIGLRIDGNDQTSDIIEVIRRAVMKAKELKDEGFEVILVFGGDTFNDNDPSEAQIGAFISILALIKEHDIQTYVMVGNHEARANPERLSCLSFIKEASVGFPSVTLIEDIACIHAGQSMNGKAYITFLPHVSKALIEKKGLDCTPQEYINKKCEKILAQLEGKKCDHIVLSHLNVKGCHGGSEEDLLKRSDVYLPNSLTEGCVSSVRPYIIQAHIHSHQVMEFTNSVINIVGSPVFCSFNEHGAKQFGVMNVGRDVGDFWGLEYVPSGTTEFYSLELDMFNQTEPFFKLPDVVEGIKALPLEQKFVLKIDVTINPENNTYDWKKIKQTLETKFPLAIIKQIDPRIVSKRLARNPNQKASLSPDAALQAFIKGNWKDDKVKARAIYKTAKAYL